MAAKRRQLARVTAPAAISAMRVPDRSMIVTAVNAHTGELAAFDRDSGVCLVDAVTASTALPGLVPTVSINGTRHIDGGVRSPDNADLACGYANVVALSPLGGRSQAPPEWGTDLPSQVEALRGRGSRVEVITPDTDSRAAMGASQLDPATRIPAARAGFAQGKRAATRVTAAKASAVARPMPEPPPVIRTALPVNRWVIFPPPVGVDAG